MKYSHFKSVLAISFLLLIILGCEKEPTEPSKVPTPELTSIEPEAGFAGESATITGKNFNPDPKKNLIRFGYHSNFGYKSIRADEATKTTLTFTRPTISAVGEDIVTSVRVRRIDDPDQTLSNAIDITFNPIISIFVEDLGHTRGIAFDSEGNCYVGTVEPDTVWKITPEGQQTVYAAVGGRGALVFNSEGYLYLGRVRDQEIVRIPPGGGSSEVVTNEIPGNPISLDFDVNGNLYVGTSDPPEGMWRVTPGGEVSRLDIGDFGWYVTLKVYNGYVYWFDREFAWLRKAPITTDGLGTPETIFEYPEKWVYFPTGLSIDTEGRVYLGGGWDHFTLDRINPDGTLEELLTLPTDNFKFTAFWGQYLYITTQLNGVVYKAFLGVEGGAP